MIISVISYAGATIIGWLVCDALFEFARLARAARRRIERMP